METLVTISEDQLESLNRLVSAGFVQLDGSESENSSHAEVAHGFLIDARQALVKAQEQPEALG